MAIYQTMLNGMKMLSMGLGTYNASTDEEMERTINTALELGYRHIDTAYVYDTEAPIGRVLKKWLDSGKVKREELFITTKLPSEALYVDKVEKCLDMSLQNLQVDYVDLYLIHYPMALRRLDDGSRVFDSADHLSVWKKLEELVDAGKIKAIGLSNFNVLQTEKIRQNCRIKPSCNQLELSPFIQQRDLVEYCQKSGIVVVSYSSFGSPGRMKPGLGVRMGSFPFPNILADETIIGIARKYGRTTAQVILRFFIQKSVVMIPKSANPSRMRENMDIFNFSMTDEDVRTIEGLDKDEMGWTVDPGLKHPNLRTHPDYPWK